jgi:hypothetical protein
LAPNPIDFAVVGDRTGSMGSASNDLETAIESLLEYLTPSQHHVALGTIGRSSSTAPASCKSQPSGSKSSGPWFPVGLSDDYDLTDVTPPSSPASLNTTGGSPSLLARAADCISTNSSTGTYLAAPMRAATKLLMGTCPATLCASGLALRPAPVKKGIIFMTDGEPNEDTNPGDGYPYDTDGGNACTKAIAEAATAKNNGIMVVTIAFRLGNVRCESGGTRVNDTLATMASPRANGTPSVDDGGGAGSGCDTAARINGENTDGDYFFCTPTAAELEPIFRTAASQIAGGVRLVKLP